MSSITSLFGSVGAAVAALQEADLSCLDAQARLVLLRDVAALRRRMDAVQMEVVRDVDRTGAYAVDGFLNARAALKHLGRLPGREAAEMVRLARLADHLPTVVAAHARGEVPTAHLAVLARVASNPRVQEHLAGAEPFFLDNAREASFEFFRELVLRWEDLADEDGAEQQSERQHRRRRFSAVADLEGQVVLRGNIGALQGAEFLTVLSVFEDAEWHKDWDDACAVWGPEEAEVHLRRTPEQRRADALVAMARRAMATAVGVEPEPLVEIVIDHETFERELARRTGAELPPDDLVARARRSVCRTADGIPLVPSDVVEAAIVGHVRRVVVDDQDVVINLGRKRRMFTGAARRAVLLGAAISKVVSRGCAWLSCGAPAGRCQIDHRRRWADGGLTDVQNGDVNCGRHNRLHETRFLMRRGDDGSVRFERPDGTAVTRAA